MLLSSFILQLCTDSKGRKEKARTVLRTSKQPFSWTSLGLSSWSPAVPQFHSLQPSLGHQTSCDTESLRQVQGDQTGSGQLRQAGGSWSGWSASDRAGPLENLFKAGKECLQKIPAMSFHNKNVWHEEVVGCFIDDIGRKIKMACTGALANDAQSTVASGTHAKSR